MSFDQQVRERVGCGAKNAGVFVWEANFALGVFQPMSHRQDADPTDYVSPGNPLSVPPIPTQDCNRRVEKNEPSR